MQTGKSCLKSILIWETAQNTTVSGEIGHRTIQDSIFGEKEKTNVFSARWDYWWGIFPFCTSWKTCIQDIVKGNGVPKLTPHKVRHKPTCNSRFPCKRKRAWHVRIRFCKGWADCVGYDWQLKTLFLISFWLLSQLRYDHYRHH